MTLLIDALPAVAASISQPAVKSLLVVLLSATHANDVSHQHHHYDLHCTLHCPSLSQMNVTLRHL